MRLGPPPTRPLLIALLALLLGSLLAAVVPSSASAAQATTLTLSAPPQYADRDVTLTVSLTSGGAGVAGPVTIVRRNGEGWEPLATVVTDADGAATLAVRVARGLSRNDLHASYAGDGTTYDADTVTYRLPLKAHPTTTRLSGRAYVVDGESVLTRVTRTTTDGRAVAGPVVLQRYLSGAWKYVMDLRTNSEGYVVFRLAPRSDARYRAVGLGLPWAEPAVSNQHVIDNRPPGVPVRLPEGAPRPRVRLPAQARAVGAGANPVVSRISDQVWSSMVGRSWHRGCPVGRSSLRLLRVNYWDYAGYRRRGELVAASSVVHQMSGALTAMYHEKLPVRSMYRVDRFGWSDRLQGADDYRSMAAGNTSAFNCRWVVGRPGIRSPHTYGRALDINPWENPYRSSHGWTPNGWWPSRSHERVAWRSRAHRVVQIMANHGLRWTYGRSDSQHFDAVPRGGRVLRAPGCAADDVCH